MAEVMSDNETEIRPSEVTVEAPPADGPVIGFIGQCRTPWKSRRDCPRRGDLDGPLCQLVIDPAWLEALSGMEEHGHMQVLYWMHHARRDLVLQTPKRDGRTIGTFAIRSPNRPNPIASSLVKLERVEGNILHVRGLDCVDGTPLVDIKPEKCPHA